jgi:hypothetical protein
VIPTASDDVSIGHAVTIAGNAAAKTITINSGGSLTTASTWAMTSKVTLTVGSFTFNRVINDTRAVRLDGITLILTTPSITSNGSGGGFPAVSGVVSTANTVIIDDPGVISYSAQMQDIKPEGCAIAYSRKVSNGVRYMTVTVHIKADRCDLVGQLYRMAEGPFQVLASTYSGVLKGFIEAITPVDSVGKEYRAFRVSIAEGQSE